MIKTIFFQKFILERLAEDRYSGTCDRKSGKSASAGIPTPTRLPAASAGQGWQPRTQPSALLLKSFPSTANDSHSNASVQFCKPMRPEPVTIKCSAGLLLTPAAPRRRGRPHARTAEGRRSFQEGSRASSYFPAVRLRVLTPVPGAISSRNEKPPSPSPVRPQRTLSPVLLTGFPLPRE